MENARNILIKNLSLIVEKISSEKITVNLGISSEASHGEYSSNIALVLSKKLAKKPSSIAEQIKQEIESQRLEFIEKIEVAGPGFINFFLTQKYLMGNLNYILEQKEKYGESKHARGFKVMVEFTDPNPLKEFHIGHLYSNTVGEALSRLFEENGADVWRVCYQGDVGLHVAKALYGILKNEVKISELEHESLEAKAKFLGEAYALGAKAYEKQENAKKEIENINKKVYEKNTEIYPLYEKVKQWSLDYFETIYKRLGTRFKRYYFESESGEKGMKIVRQNMGKVFVEDENAVIFPEEKSGLHTRVFINSLGLPTYEAKELGLAPTKYADFPYDLSVIITGNEVNEYFKVLLKALSLIYPDLADKTKHIGHGMVRLPYGKMSSRTGDVITGEALLEEVKNKLKLAHPDMGSDVTEQLTVGAIKYAFLKSHLGGDIIFNIEESINLHGNSGPYVQYTYARTQSILNKSKAQIIDIKDNNKLEVEEREALRKLAMFPEVILEAAEKCSPNLVLNYLFEVSQLFNIYYEKHRVLNIEDEGVKNFRLALVVGIGYVIKNGLNILGISAPQKI